MSGQLEEFTWARRLKMRHLEIFLLLDETSSITATSEVLHLTQPAVSHWLSDLEDAVGMKLFVRGRKLRLAPMGVAFKNYALRTLGEVKRAGLEFEAIRSGLSRRIRIGSILSIGIHLLPGAIESMRRQYPGIQLEVDVGNFDALLERMGRRELDIVLGPLDGRASTSGYASALVDRDETVIVASTDHLIHRSRATWRRLLEHTWILPPRGTLVRSTFEHSVLQKQGTIPQPAIETSSLPTQLALMERGDYLALLHRSTAAYYQKLGLLKVVPLRLIGNAVPLAAFWEENHADVLVQDLIRMLKRRPHMGHPGRPEDGGHDAADA